MRISRRLAAAFGAGCAVLGLLVPGTARAADPPDLGVPDVVLQGAGVSVKAITFNICGNVCRSGEVRGTSSNIANQISTRRPGLVFLQEVCYSQFKAVQARIASKGYSSTFVQTTKGGKCDRYDRRHGEGFGLALAVKGRFTGRTVRWLPSPSALRAEPRALLGVTTTVAGRSTFVATTHTAPGGPNLAVQLKTIAKYVDTIGARKPVIVAGDFNALPDNPGLDAFYSDQVTNGRGMFRELHDTYATPEGTMCRCGEETFDIGGRKIDYVFATRRHFRPVIGDSMATGYSDHRLYFGTYRSI